MALKLKNTTTAPAKDVIGWELRRRIREEDGERREEALTEHRRRCTNLVGGLVPAWEVALRGPDPTKWAPE